MRIISLITAVAVVSILYVLVFERDVLRGFSNGENIEELANDLGDGPELNTEVEYKCSSCRRILTITCFASTPTISQKDWK